MKKTVAAVMATAVMATASTASAQDAVFPPHGYVMGQGGLTFSTATAPVFGAEVGANVGPIVKVYGSFDWHRDIAPTYVGDAVKLVGLIYNTDLSVRAPAYTVLAGTRVQAPRGSVRPYGLGGFGYGRSNVRVEIEEVNVSSLLNLEPISEPLLEVGGGGSWCRRVGRSWTSATATASSSRRRMSTSPGSMPESASGSS